MHVINESPVVWLYLLNRLKLAYYIIRNVSRNDI